MRTPLLMRSPGYNEGHRGSSPVRDIGAQANQALQKWRWWLVKDRTGVCLREPWRYHEMVLEFFE